MGEGGVPLEALDFGSPLLDLDLMMHVFGISRERRAWGQTTTPITLGGPRVVLHRLRKGMIGAPTELSTTVKPPKDESSTPFPLSFVLP